MALTTIKFSHTQHPRFIALHKNAGKMRFDWLSLENGRDGRR
jgi:hypothetical protein